MNIKKITDLPIGELGEENYVVADIDGEVKKVRTEDIGGGGADSMVVNFEIDWNTRDEYGNYAATADKTIREILDAIKSGKNVSAQYANGETILLSLMAFEDGEDDGFGYVYFTVAKYGNEYFGEVEELYMGYDTDEDGEVTYESYWCGVNSASPTFAEVTIGNEYGPAAPLYLFNDNGKKFAITVTTEGTLSCMEVEP